jgi:hypothetical protein
MSPGITLTLEIRRGDNGNLRKQKGLFPVALIDLLGHPKSGVIVLATPNDLFIINRDLSCFGKIHRIDNH